MFKLIELYLPLKVYNDIFKLYAKYFMTSCCLGIHSSLQV